MNDRARTLAAVTVIVGFLVLVAIIVGVVVSGKKIVSPVPDEGAIKIIFVTPTIPIGSTLQATPAATLKATLTPKPTRP